MRTGIMSLLALASLGSGIDSPHTLAEDYAPSPNKGKMGRKQAHLTPKQLKARQKSRSKRKNKKSHR